MVVKRKALNVQNRVSIGLFQSKVLSVQENLSIPMFHMIVPPPSEVLPKLATFNSFQSQCEIGNRAVIPDRDAIKQEILNDMAKQCWGVNLLANGDMTILSKCGFDISKERGVAPVPGVPYFKGITPGCDDGEIELHLKGNKQAKFYVLEVIDMDGNLIREVTLNKAKSPVYNLPVNVLLRARACSVNARGRSVWTAFYPFSISLYEGNQNVLTMAPAKSKKSSEENPGVA